MKLAIVGTSHLSDNEANDARKAIIFRIRDAQKEMIDNEEVEILTGDAEGIDRLVREIAIEQRLDLKVFCSKQKHWEGYGGFRERNIRIAEQCDEITSIVTKVKKEDCYHHKLSTIPHERSGGCWTMEYAKHINCHVKGDFLIV